MDVADGSAEQSAMIALLPITSEWCKQDLPHMTLVYAGLISDLQVGDFNDMAKDAASIAMLSSPITLRVTGVEVFGEEEKVDVLKLDKSSEVMAMRKIVDDWNASEHPFNPHCTIGPLGSSMAIPEIPRWVAFNRIYVGYGEESLTFWLKGGNNY